MDDNTTAELIADARAKFEKAHDELIRILSVDERVRMTIPANPAEDTDLVIVAALDAGRSLADALAALSRPVPDDTAQATTDLETITAHLKRVTQPQLEKRYWGGLEWAIARTLGLTHIARMKEGKGTK